jgi:hypothetical protein
MMIAYFFLIGLAFFVISIGTMLVFIAPVEKDASDWEKFLSRWSPLVSIPFMVISMYLLLNLAPGLYKAQASGASELIHTSTQECIDTESRKEFEKCMPGAMRLINLIGH